MSDPDAALDPRLRALFRALNRGLLALWRLGLGPALNCGPTRLGLNLIVGAGLGALAMLVLLALEVARGWLVVDGWHLAGQVPARWLHAAWLALLVKALPVAGEEALFRGYLLSALRRAWGPWPAVLLMALPFGAAHIRRLPRAVRLATRQSMRLDQFSRSCASSAKK